MDQIKEHQESLFQKLYSPSTKIYESDLVFFTEEMKPHLKGENLERYTKAMGNMSLNSLAGGMMGFALSIGLRRYFQYFKQTSLVSCMVDVAMVSLGVSYFYANISLPKFHYEITPVKVDLVKSSKPSS